MIPDRSVDDLLTMATKMVRPVLGLTVYLKSGLPNHRVGVSRAIEAFLARAEPELTWYSDTKIQRFRKTTSKLLRYPIRWLDEPSSGPKHFSWVMLSAENFVDAPAFLLEGCNAPKGLLSYLRITLPYDVFDQDPQRFLESVREFVSDLPVHYGYAGLVFGESQQAGTRQVNSNLLYVAAMRFHGLEVDVPLTTSVSVINDIKGINWLTLLHNDFVNRLGGSEALRAQLSPAITVHPLAHGLMLQAGERPGVGDVNAGQRLPAYREVARVLKPIRTKTHPPLAHESDRSFGDLGTAEWLRRFDD